MEQKRLPIFAERFAELRKDMTQGAFAKLLGISRPTVGFYENGTRVPDALILRQIAEKCQVSTDWLMGLSNDQKVERTAIDDLGLSPVAVSEILDYKLTDILGTLPMLNAFLEHPRFRAILNFTALYQLGRYIDSHNPFAFDCDPSGAPNELKTKELQKVTDIITEVSSKIIDSDIGYHRLLLGKDALDYARYEIHQVLLEILDEIISETPKWYFNLDSDDHLVK